jgi:hypothetical protein
MAACSLSQVAVTGEIGVRPSQRVGHSGAALRNDHEVNVAGH